MTTASTVPSRGGSFVLGPPAAIFKPEDFSEQQQLIAQTAEAFAQGEIASAGDQIERQEFSIIRGLLQQAGTLGLTGVDIPEAYGGLGLDFSSSAIVADHLAVQGSFSVVFGAHTGIATLPLVYFGSEEQKRKYLPKLASAAWVGAYALSEAGSGSDALALRTHAALTADGQHYILNGEKMWISNAGFADLFTVFAKVGERVTAFLVESAYPGVTTGTEEHKMGIAGSSTRPLILRDVPVPTGNMLGGVGDGAHIAFQILNVGRFKLGAACVGGARNTLRTAIAYARERRAFGKPIASFGLVQQMLADMVLGIFASESVVYRTVGMMEGAQALDEYAIECSIVKVQASEMLDRAVDNAVQIHGGYGFVRGNPAERAYRDSRVNRIFEGTNEINRLLIAGLLLRRGQKGALPLPAAIEQIMAALLEPAAGREIDRASERARRAALLVAGLAFQKHRESIANEQEILAAIADLLIGVYVMQSVEARRPGSPLAEVILSGTLDLVETTARQVIASVSAGDAQRTQQMWVNHLLKRNQANVYALRRQIAEEAIELGRYPG